MMGIFNIGADYVMVIPMLNVIFGLAVFFYIDCPLKMFEAYFGNRNQTDRLKFLFYHLSLSVHCGLCILLFLAIQNQDAKLCQFWFYSSMALAGIVLLVAFLFGNISRAIIPLALLTGAVFLESFIVFNAAQSFSPNHSMWAGVSLFSMKGAIIGISFFNMVMVAFLFMYTLGYGFIFLWGAFIVGFNPGPLAVPLILATVFIAHGVWAVDLFNAVKDKNGEGCQLWIIASLVEIAATLGCFLLPGCWWFATCAIHFITVHILYDKLSNSAK